MSWQLLTLGELEKKLQGNVISLNRTHGNNYKIGLAPKGSFNMIEFQGTLESCFKWLIMELEKREGGKLSTERCPGCEDCMAVCPFWEE